MATEAEMSLSSILFSFLQWDLKVNGYNFLRLGSILFSQISTWISPAGT